MASREDDDELFLIREDSKQKQRGRAAVKKSTLVVLCILFVELCERLTFYGVAANLVFYCKDVLKLGSPLPSTISLAFQGITQYVLKHVLLYLTVVIVVVVSFSFLLVLVCLFVCLFLSYSWGVYMWIFFSQLKTEKLLSTKIAFLRSLLSFLYSC